MLRKVINLKERDAANQNALQISRGLVEDFKNFKIQIRNRREKIDPGRSEFQAVFKRELWKLNQEGDIMNPEHWLKREMWLARNGAFCYFSQKEGKELQYYKSEDIKSVVAREIPYPSESGRLHAFSLTLQKTDDGLEYSPGVFAAEDEDSKRTFLACIKKFQSRVRAKQEAKAERERQQSGVVGVSSADI